MLLSTKAVLQHQLQDLINECSSMQVTQSSQLAQLEGLFRQEVEVYKRGDEVGRIEIRNEALQRENQEIGQSSGECREELLKVRDRLAGVAAEVGEVKGRREALMGAEADSSDRC